MTALFHHFFINFTVCLTLNVRYRFPTKVVSRLTSLFLFEKLDLRQELMEPRCQAIILWQYRLIGSKHAFENYMRAAQEHYTAAAGLTRAKLLLAPLASTLI